ncbi:MAG: hypothetical protein RSD95_15165, partial [Clostridia bacterium]
MDGNNKASSIFPSRAGRGARTVSKFVLSCPLPVQKAPPPGARERASESRVPSDANLQTHIRDLLSDENC